MNTLWAIFNSKAEVVNYTKTELQAKRYATANGYNLVGYTEGDNRKWVTHKKIDSGKWEKVLDRFPKK